MPRACSASARSKLSNGTIEVAARGEEQATAAREDRECPGPVERSRPRFPGGQDVVGLVELADGDQRLEEIAELEALGGLEHEGVANLVGSA